MIINKQNFITRINEADSDAKVSQLANQIASEPVPWFFEKKFGLEASIKYQEFRLYMNQRFGVIANEVTIAGSANLGFSLSPDKKYTDFHEESDIDIVLIDKKRFNLFWDASFNDFVKGKVKGTIYKNIATNTYKRFIDFKNDYVKNNDLFIKWEKETGGYVKDLQIKFDFPEIIGYRIYRSWEDYIMNIKNNIKDLQKYGGNL